MTVFRMSADPGICWWLTVCLIRRAAEAVLRFGLIRYLPKRRSMGPFQFDAGDSRFCCSLVIQELRKKAEVGELLEI